MVDRKLVISFGTEGYGDVVRQLQQGAKLYDEVLQKATQAAQEASRAQQEAADASDPNRISQAERQRVEAVRRSNRVIQASYRELNIKSSEQIELMRRQAESAYRAIAASGIASTRDIEVAHAAMIKRMGDLDDLYEGVSLSPRPRPGGGSGGARIEIPGLTDLPDRIGEAVEDAISPKKNPLEAVGSLITAPFKFAGGIVGDIAKVPFNLAQGIVNDVARGFTEDIGRTLSEEFARQPTVQAANKSKQVGSSISRNIIGDDNVFSSALAAWIRTGKFENAVKTGFGQTKLNQDFLVRINKLKQIATDPNSLQSVLDSDLKLAEIYANVVEDIRRRDNGFGKKAQKFEAFSRFMDAAQPVSFASEVINPIIQEFTGLLGFIQKVQSFNTIALSEKVYNERKASFPILNGKDVVSVVGGAQFAGGQGGRRIATSIEPLLPNARVIPVENPESDRRKDIVPPLEKAFIDLLKRFNPKVEQDKASLSTLVNAFRQVIYAVNPFATSTAAAQALANTRLAQEQGQKANVVTFSLGGAEGIRYDKAAELAGIKDSSVVAMNYPFMNFLNNAKNFRSSIVGGDPLSFPLKLGVGVPTSKMDIYNSAVVGENLHSHKHLFKEIDFLNKFFKDLDQDLPNLTTEEMGSFVHVFGRVYELMGTFEQVRSIIDTGDFNLQSPFVSYTDPPSDLTSNLAKMSEYKTTFKGILAQSVGMGDRPESQAAYQEFAQAMLAKFEQLEKDVVKYFQDRGGNLPNDLEKNLSGYFKYLEESSRINSTLEVFKTGKLPEDPDHLAYFAGKLDPNLTKSRLQQLEKETISWFKSSGGGFGDYQAKIVEGYERVLKVAKEFVQNAGKLSEETRDSIELIQQDELSDDLKAVLEKQFNPYDLPKEEQVRELQVEVPEAFKRYQTAILHYNKLIETFGKDVIPDINEIPAIGLGATGAATLIGKDLVYKNDIQESPKIASQSEVGVYEHLKGRYSPLLYASETGKGLITERVSGESIKDKLLKLAKPFREISAELEKATEGGASEAELSEIRGRLREARRTFRAGSKELIQNIGQMLRTLHEMDVVHGDMHAGNILQGDNGELNAIDFGSSQVSTSKLAKAKDLLVAMDRLGFDSSFWGLLNRVSIAQDIYKGYSKPLPEAEARAVDPSKLKAQKPGVTIPLGSYTPSLLTQFIGGVPSIPTLPPGASLPKSSSALEKEKERREAELRDALERLESTGRGYTRDDQALDQLELAYGIGSTPAIAIKPKTESSKAIAVRETEQAETVELSAPSKALIQVKAAVQDFGETVQEFVDDVQMGMAKLAAIPAETIGRLEGQAFETFPVLSEAKAKIQNATEDAVEPLAKVPETLLKPVTRKIAEILDGLTQAEKDFLSRSPAGGLAKAVVQAGAITSGLTLLPGGPAALGAMDAGAVQLAGELAKDFPGIGNTLIRTLIEHFGDDTVRMLGLDGLAALLTTFLTNGIKKVGNETKALTVQETNKQIVPQTIETPSGAIAALSQNSAQQFSTFRQTDRKLLATLQGGKAQVSEVSSLEELRQLLTAPADRGGVVTAAEARLVARNLGIKASKYKNLSKKKITDLLFDEFGFSLEQIQSAVIKTLEETRGENEKFDPKQFGYLSKSFSEYVVAFNKTLNAFIRDGYGLADDAALTLLSDISSLYVSIQRLKRDSNLTSAQRQRVSGYESQLANLFSRFGKQGAEVRNTLDAQHLSDVRDELNPRQSSEKAISQVFSGQVSSKAEKVGEELAAGFADGIEKASGEGADAVSKMVDEAIDTAKSDLEIQSPSKVTFRIGRDFVAGFELALEDLSRVEEIVSAALDLAGIDASQFGGIEKIAENIRKGTQDATKDLSIDISQPFINTRGISQLIEGIRGNLAKIRDEYARGIASAKPGEKFAQSIEGSGEKVAAEAQAVVDEVQAVIDNSLDVLEQAWGDLGFNQALNQIQDEVGAFSQEFKPIEKLQGLFGGVFDGIIEGYKRLEAQFPSIGRLKDLLFDVAQAGLGLLGVFTLGDALFNFGQQAVGTSIKMEALERNITSVSDSSYQGQAKIESLRRVIQNLGLDVVAATQFYSRLGNAFAGTELESLAEQSFKSISGFLAARGADSQEQDRAFQGLLQTFSKGRLQSEELRSQLAEIPATSDILQVSARSLGKTVAQLNRDMKDGRIASEEYAVAITSQLQAETDLTSYLASNQVLVNKLTAEWTYLTQGVGDFILNAGRPFLSWAADAVRWLDDNLVPILKVTGIAILYLVSPLAQRLLAFLLTQIIQLGNAFLSFSLKVLQGQVSIRGFIVALRPLLGVAARFLLISAAIEGISAAFNLSKGSAEDMAIATRQAEEALRSLQRLRAKDPDDKPKPKEKTFTDHLFSQDTYSNAFLNIPNLAEQFFAAIGEGFGSADMFGGYTPKASSFAKSKPKETETVPVVRDYALETKIAEVSSETANTLEAAAQTVEEARKELPTVPRILELKQELAALRTKALDIPSGDRLGVDANLKVQESLVKQISDLSRYTSGATSSLAASQKTIESQLAALEQRKKESPELVPQYNTQKLQLEGQLKEVIKTQDKFKAAQNAVSAALSGLELKLRDASEALSGFKERAELRKNQRTVQTINRGMLEGISSSQIQEELAQGERSDRGELASELRSKIAELYKYLNSGIVQRVFKTLGINLKTVSTETLNRLGQDETLNPDQQSVIKTVTKVKELEAELSQNQVEIAQDALTLKTQISDFNKSVSDYLRNLSRTLEDVRVQAVDQLDSLKDRLKDLSFERLSKAIDRKIQEAQNNLKRFQLNQQNRFNDSPVQGVTGNLATATSPFQSVFQSLQERLGRVGEFSKFNLDAVQQAEQTRRQIRDLNKSQLAAQLSIYRQVVDLKLAQRDYLRGLVVPAGGKTIALPTQSAQPKTTTSTPTTKGKVTPNAGGPTDDLPTIKGGNTKLRAIALAAQALGVTPEDVATIIQIESSFQNKVGGSGNRYKGYLQFGTPAMTDLSRAGLAGKGTDARKYSFEEQLNLFVNYALMRGYKPGMGVRSLYTTHNLGNPNATGVDGFGTPGGKTSKLNPDSTERQVARQVLSSLAQELPTLMPQLPQGQAATPTSYSIPISQGEIRGLFGRSDNVIVLPGMSQSMRDSLSVFGGVGSPQSSQIAQVNSVVQNFPSRSQLPGQVGGLFGDPRNVIALPNGISPSFAQSLQVFGGIGQTGKPKQTEPVQQTSQIASGESPLPVQIVNSQGLPVPSIQGLNATGSVLPPAPQASIPTTSALPSLPALPTVAVPPLPGYQGDNAYKPPSYGYTPPFPSGFNSPVDVTGVNLSFPASDELIRQIQSTQTGQLAESQKIVNQLIQGYGQLDLEARAFAKTQAESLSLDLQTQSASNIAEVVAKLVEADKQTQSYDDQLRELGQNLEGLETPMVSYAANVAQIAKDSRDFNDQMSQEVLGLKKTQAQLSEYLPKLQEVIAAHQRQGQFDLAAQYQQEYNALVQLNNTLPTLLSIRERELQQYNAIQAAKSQQALRDYQLQKARFELDNQGRLQDIRSEITSTGGGLLEKRGKPFAAAELQRLDAIAQENLRFRQQIQEINELAAKLGTEATPYIQELTEAATQLNAVKLQSIEQEFGTIRNTLRDISKSSFNGFFQDALSFKKNITEIFRDLVQSIADQLTQLAADLLSSQLSSIIFGQEKSSGSGGFLKGLFGKGKMKPGSASQSGGVPGWISSLISVGSSVAGSALGAPLPTFSGPVNSLPTGDLTFGLTSGLQLFDGGLADALNDGGSPKPKYPIPEAIEKEKQANGGKPVYLAALTRGEWVLTIPQAKTYKKLEDKLGTDPLSRLALPLDSGGDEFMRSAMSIPSPQFSPISTSEPASAAQPIYNMSVNNTIVAPNPSGFRQSEDQIGRQTANQLLAHLRRG